MAYCHYPRNMPPSIACHFDFNQDLPAFQFRIYLLCQSNFSSNLLKLLNLDDVEVPRKKNI
ncbi:hypothetical protein BN2475_310159 [Paraburkholderia ribeironis]|uniref:Uncharacterized protein n=1 Tax=Paraburkholderia ribeironis TaxID=1247936 RepID=A0A1N7S2W7_9BURK|nr:hypothetical protein BN2475_310159 [Paraburkholderia ribeironis]